MIKMGNLSTEVASAKPKWLVLSIKQKPSEPIPSPRLYSIAPTSAWM